MCEAVSLRIFESEMTVSRSDAAVNFAGGAATRGAAGAAGAAGRWFCRPGKSCAAEGPRRDSLSDARLLRGPIELCPQATDSDGALLFSQEPLRVRAPVDLRDRLIDGKSSGLQPFHFGDHRHQ